jgi:hypothetical protein
MTISEAQENLVVAQTRFRKALEAQRVARGRVSQAIIRWQTTVGGTPNHTALAKAHIASEQERKRQIAEGRAHPAQRSRPGKSYIDRVRFYQGRGDANDFLRKQMRRGASRGAYPSSMRGQKLPSDV